MKVGVLVLFCFVCVKSILSHDNFVYSTQKCTCGQVLWKRSGIIWVGHDWATELNWTELKQPSLWNESASDRRYIFCFKDSNETFTFFFEDKELHLKLFFCPNMFRVKASQAMILFYFVMCICKEPRYNTATKTWWLWSLTGLPFLCVLSMHWEDLYLFQFS